MRTNLKNLAYLAAINGLLAILIGLRYFENFSISSMDMLGIAFLSTAVFSQMLLLSLVASLPLLLFTILPKRAFSYLAAVYFACFVSVLLIDTVVFSQYKFHINFAMLSLIMAGDVVDFPLIAWLTSAAVFVCLVAAELGLLKLININWAIKSKRPLKKLGIALFLALLTTNVLHIWGAANAHQNITKVHPFLPAFYPATANGFMSKRGWINKEKVAQQKALASKKGTTLNYPLQPIKTQEVTQPVNIMVILFDSWRYDTMNEKNSPNVWQLAQQGVSFNNHIAAGNSTTTGIFGFYYGLHGTYWHRFLNNQQPPILITRMQELGYQIGVFASAQLYRPEFDKTVFATVPNLRIRSEGRTPSERDLNAIEDWKSWYKQQSDAAPTFSFIFLDSAHGYDAPENMEKPYLPETGINYLKLNKDTERTGIFNRYKNSVYYMDSLVGEVIEQLRESGQLENTLFVISGDHGQEINDTKQNNWGHNSNFTDYQVKVPMIIVGPKAEQLRHLANSQAVTHHLDMAPTLLKNYLGITNPVKDFSLGMDWFDERQPIQRPWVLSAAYNKFALITDELIFEVDPQGRSKMVDKEDRPVAGKALPSAYIKEALNELSRFSK